MAKWCRPWTEHTSHCSPHRTFSISRWNVAGAFVRPKLRIVNWNSPSPVVKAGVLFVSFFLSFFCFVCFLGLPSICQNPLRRYMVLVYSQLKSLDIRQSWAEHKHLWQAPRLVCGSQRKIWCFRLFWWPERREMPRHLRMVRWCSFLTVFFYFFFFCLPFPKWLASVTVLPEQRFLTEQHGQLMTTPYPRPCDPE